MSKLFRYLPFVSTVWSGSLDPFYIVTYYILGYTVVVLNLWASHAQALPHDLCTILEERYMVERCIYRKRTHREKGRDKS